MKDDLRRSEPQRFRVLAASVGFEPGFRGGGPIPLMAAIVDTVPSEIDICLITRDRDFGSTKPYPGRSGRWVRRGHAQVFYLNVRRPGQWFRLWRHLRSTPFDLLYVNSLFQPIFSVAAILAVKLRVLPVQKILVAPSGELSPGALSLKRHKKRLFLMWWVPFLKTMKVVLHATSDMEASHIRSVVPWAEIELNRDQISLPYEPLSAGAEHPGPIRLVFVGRISPKKNLHLVLSTLTTLSIPAEFDIFGPLEDAKYWLKCRALMSWVPAHIQVSYRGELIPATVPWTFSRYDAFVFPTLGENFGRIIAESLSASCPVICSDQTPWTEVLESGGGVVVRNLTPAALGHELERLAAMTPAERLGARRAAGIAYRLWRRTADHANIFEQARGAEWSSR